MNKKVASKCLFFLIVIAVIITRFWHIGNFDKPVQDEVFYATMASQYLSKTPFVDVHPPAARLIFAFMAKIGGADGTNRFPSKEISYGNFPYGLLRSASAFMGVMFVIFLMLLAKEISRSNLVALMAGFLALFENFFIVYSRYILADIFILTFGIGGLWFF